MFSDGYDVAATSLEAEDFEGLSSDSEEERFASTLGSALNPKAVGLKDASQLLSTSIVAKTPLERLKTWAACHISPFAGEMVANLRLTRGPDFSNLSSPSSMWNTTECEFRVRGKSFRYDSQSQSLSRMKILVRKNVY